MTKPSFGRQLFNPSPHKKFKASLILTQISWYDSFPNLAPRSQQSSLIKSMSIKVQEVTFRLCENLNPKLLNYNTWMGSWLAVLDTTTNQPFGMHFKHVRVLTNSSCLPPLLGPRLMLAPKWQSNFDLGLHKKVPFFHATSQLF